MPEQVLGYVMRITFYRTIVYLKTQVSFIVTAIVVGLFSLQCFTFFGGISFIKHSVKKLKILVNAQ